MRKVFFLLLLPFSVCAQRERTLLFEKIEGLSQNTVYSILKDRQGFMWLATADGLNRYDGVEMKVYKPSIDNKPGTYSNRLIRYRLVEDQFDQIWFSNGAGVYVFNKKKNFFELQPIRNEIGILGLEPLMTEANHFWGLNGGIGIFDYDMTSKKWIVYKPPGGITNETYSSTSIKDTQGNFWLLCNKGILFYDRQRNEWKKLFANTQFLKIGAGPGLVYLATEKELYTCSSTNFQLTTVPVISPGKHALFTAFCIDKHQATWAGDMMGNVFCRQKGSDGFTWRGNIHNGQAGTTSFPILSLLVDENEILWAGTDVMGLCKANLKPPSFSVFPAPGSAGEPLFVHAIYEDQADNIWIGTYRRGLLQLNKRTGVAKQVELFNSPDPDENSISVIREDAQGDLFVGTYKKLFVRRKGTEQFVRVTLPEPVKRRQPLFRPFALYEHGDSIYISSHWGLHRLFRKSDSFITDYYDEAGGFFYDIFIDKKHRYWLAAENGIFQEHSLRSFDKDPADTILFSNAGIKSFLEDTVHSLLWISTTNGLIAYHLPTGRYKIFSEAEGMGNSYVYGCLENENELWISTNRGLSRAIVSWPAQEVLPALRFINFTSKDGLPDDEFNSNAFHKGRNGDLYFGTIKGLVWFDPGEVRLRQAAPSIVITGLLVNEQPVDSTSVPEFTQELRLPYYRNSIFLKFRGIEYVNADKVQYAYLLEGWDKDWIFSGTLNQVRYNNLPPGQYTFKVKAANEAGAWEEKAYMILINIRPPFWKTWWFYSLASLTAMVTLIFITRYFSQQKLKRKVAELERQKEIDKERQRISREMHDDIGSGLTQITLMSESAKSKKGTQSEKELDDIADTSRKLVSNMSEIVWSLNPGNKTLNHLMAYLREQLHKLLEYSGIVYTIQLPESEKEIFLSNDQRRNILLITKEIVNNAIKHSRSKNIMVTAKLHKGVISFTVNDDGCGFVQSGKYNGNGLRNIRQRVEELGGKLTVESGNEKGTSFEYSIPLHPTT